MIISKEIRDNANATSGKELCISYVNPEGKIDFFQHLITTEEWFEWKTCAKHNAAPPEYVIDRNTDQLILDKNGQPQVRQWMSYDGKYVNKKYLPKNSYNLSWSRISEILNQYGNRIDYVFDMNKPNLVFVDIETLVTEDSGFPKAETAAQPITTISLTQFPRTIIWSWTPLSEEDQQWVQDHIDNYSEENATDLAMKNITKGYKFEYRYFATEREMMQDFINFINTFTAICGWNFLQYDWKYIHNRCTILGIDMTFLSPSFVCQEFSLQPRVGGHKISLPLPLHKIIFDYMLIIQNWDTTIDHPENYTLDYIAERVLSIKKVNHEWGFAEFFKHHFKEYVFYNCIDTILIEQIDKVVQTATIWYMLASILRLDLNSVYSTITPAENVMTNFIYPDYKVIPRAEKKKIDDIQEDYMGAFVWPTRPCVGRLIGGLDFASLYPTIMRQFGISPEVFVEKNLDREPTEDEIKTVSGAIYRKDKDAIIPAILTHYFGLRKQAKSDKKQAEAELEYYKTILHKRKMAMKPAEAI